MAQATYDCQNTQVVFSADVEYEDNGEPGQAPECIICNLEFDRVVIFGLTLTPEQIDQLPDFILERMDGIGNYEVDYD